MIRLLTVVAILIILNKRLVTFFLDIEATVTVVEQKQFVDVTFLADTDYCNFHR